MSIFIIIYVTRTQSIKNRTLLYLIIDKNNYYRDDMNNYDRNNY